MTAIAATPAGANRPEFTPFPGLGRYFPNPTGALLYPIGNAFTSAGSFLKEQVGERLSNLVSNKGLRTDAEFASLLAETLGQASLDKQFLVDNAGGYGTGYGEVQDKRQQAIKMLKGWGYEVGLNEAKVDAKTLKILGKNAKELGKNYLHGFQFYTEEKFDTAKIQQRFSVGLDDDGESTQLVYQGTRLNGQNVGDGSVVRVSYDRRTQARSYEAVKLGDLPSGANVYVNGISNFKVTDILDSARFASSSLRNADMYAVLNLDSELIEAGIQGFSAVMTGKPAYQEKAQDVLEVLLQTGKPMTIFAHSEGNAIALNAIANSQAWLENGDVRYFGFAPATDGSTVPNLRKDLLASDSTIFYNGADEALAGPSGIKGLLNLTNITTIPGPTKKQQTYAIGQTATMEMQARWKAAGYNVEAPRNFLTHSFKQGNFQWAFDKLGQRR